MKRPLLQSAWHDCASTRLALIAMAVFLLVEALFGHRLVSRAVAVARTTPAETS